MLKGNMAQEFITTMEEAQAAGLDRIANEHMTRIARRQPGVDLTKHDLTSLELLDMPPPRSSGPFQINFDLSDFPAFGVWSNRAR